MNTQYNSFDVFVNSLVDFMPLISSGEIFHNILPLYLMDL